MEALISKLRERISARTTVTPGPRKDLAEQTSQGLPVSERGVHYKVLGQPKSAPNAIDALIDILRTLSKRNPAFLEAVSKVVRGRTRNHIARSRDEVYPRKPELSEYTVELEPGWWLGTNIANRDK